MREPVHVYHIPSSIVQEEPEIFSRLFARCVGDFVRLVESQDAAYGSVQEGCRFLGGSPKGKRAKQAKLLYPVEVVRRSHFSSFLLRNLRACAFDVFSRAEPAHRAFLDNDQLVFRLRDPRMCVSEDETFEPFEVISVLPIRQIAFPSDPTDRSMLQVPLPEKNGLQLWLYPQKCRVMAEATAMDMFVRLSGEQRRRGALLKEMEKARQTLSERDQLPVPVRGVGRHVQQLKERIDRSAEAVRAQGRRKIDLSRSYAAG